MTTTCQGCKHLSDHVPTDKKRMWFWIVSPSHCRTCTCVKSRCYGTYRLVHGPYIKRVMDKACKHFEPKETNP